jgi:uroporphyrin-III C-methyltransferase
MDTGKITLVGAGPGDPGLITVKGLEAIQSADVILYDALLDQKVMDNANENVIKIFVGKRARKHTYPQDEINAMLVKYALENKQVVRLKGGDPFILGRGHEEIEYAEKYGIETEVIPGVSSATALAAMHGIPLTKRGITPGFVVISAVNSDGQLNQEFNDLVKTSLTLVVLMGLARLAEICALFESVNKKSVPVYIIQNGSFENEKSVYGTIETIQNKVEEAGISTPAVLIIGEVAALKANTGLLYEKQSLSHIFES